MIKRFILADGSITTIEIIEEGKVIYSVGKKKTTFDLSDCDSFIYEFNTRGESLVITEDMLPGTLEVEPWLWLVISKGEERLECNNDHAETRRQHSYSDQNDKFDTLMTKEDTLDLVLANLEKEALREAIQKLEPQQQKLVMDLFYRDLSMAEIARREGRHETSIRDRRNKIINKLKKNLI